MSHSIERDDIYALRDALAGLFPGQEGLEEEPELTDRYERDIMAHSSDLHALWVLRDRLPHLLDAVEREWFPRISR